MEHDDVLRALLERRAVAILRGVSGDDLPRLGEALYAGGLRVIELALAHDAPDAPARVCREIARLRALLPEDAVVGAGTVLAPEEAERARDAGARLIVAPDTNEAVIRFARGMGLVAVPGAYTPTEVAAALRAGADAIKLFPAGCLPRGYVRHLRGPFPGARFLAAAGVTEANAGEYLADGYDAVAVSGRLCERALLAARDWAEIERRARALAALARQTAKTGNSLT